MVEEFGNGRVVGPCALDGRRRLETFLETTLPLPLADLVGAGVTGDGCQPGTDRRLTAVGVERPHCPQVDLLHEILDIAARAQRHTQAPQGRLGATDQLSEGDVVSLARRLQKGAQRIGLSHTPIMARGASKRATSGNRTLTSSDLEE